MDTVGSGNAFSQLHSNLDLIGVVRSGWLPPEELSSAEFREAEAFYAAIHKDDRRLTDIRSTAIAEIADRTGATAADIGSFGVGLNLETSDLDIGMAWPVDSREKLRELLEPPFTFLGDRRTRFSNLRTAFTRRYEDVDVDLTVLSAADFDEALRMHTAIAERMSPADRVAFTWVKHLLHEAGLRAEYTRWKSAPYARFCSEFVPSVEDADS